MAFGGPPIFDMPHNDAYYSDFDDHNHEPNKKNKNGNDKGDKKSSAYKVAYEGCILQKAAPRVGEYESWARVGKHPLPGSDVELAELSKKYRKDLGDPMSAFSRLSADQQGVVNRYIEQRQSQETDKNAEWTLDCVVKHIGQVRVKNAWARTRMETKHLKVIIKRQDRNAVKSNISLTGRSNTFAAGEIIDLADPLPAKNKEKGGKKNNNKKDHNIFDDFVEPPYNGPPLGVHPDPFAGLGRDPNIMHVPPPPPPGQHFQHHHPPPPPGAIPVDQFRQPQHHGPPHHPFEPYPHFNTPDLHDGSHFQQSLPGYNPQFQTRRQTPVEHDDRRARSWSRSRSRERRREQSRDRRQREAISRERRIIREQAARDEALRLQEQEEQAEELRRQQQVNQYRMFSKLDEMKGTFEERMQELNGKVENIQLGRSRGSSNGSYNHRDEVWSLPSGGSFTPPSSPGLSDILPINLGGGGRNNKVYRDARGYPIERRNSNRLPGRETVFMEPYNGNRRRGSSSYPHPVGGNVMARVVQAPTPPRRRRTPPQLHYADDYPTGEKIRALPQYEGQEYPRAEFNSGGRRRQQHQQDERVYVYESNNDRRGRRDSRY